MTQLLHTGWPFDRDFINNRSYKDDIVSRSVEALCFTFRQFVEQLPVDKRVLCIIDNITILESKRWDADLYTVIEMICRISEDDSCHQIFKILVTAPAARTQIISSHTRSNWYFDGACMVVVGFLKDRSAIVCMPVNREETISAGRVESHAMPSLVPWLHGITKRP